MSRSYKHAPVCAMGDSDRRVQKQIANRRIRRNKELLQFAAYKRLFTSWMIVECRSYCTLRQFYQHTSTECRRCGALPDSEIMKRDWEKYYRRK